MPNPFCSLPAAGHGYCYCCSAVWVPADDGGGSRAARTERFHFPVGPEVLAVSAVMSPKKTSGCRALPFHIGHRATVYSERMWSVATNFNML